MREANRTAGMYLENIRLLWPFSQHSHADCLEVVCASWIPMKDGGEPRWSGQSLQFITSHKVLMQLRLPLFPLFARDRTSHFFFFLQRSLASCNVAIGGYVFQLPFKFSHDWISDLIYILKSSLWLLLVGHEWKQAGGPGRMVHLSCEDKHRS